MIKLFVLILIVAIATYWLRAVRTFSFGELRARMIAQGKWCDDDWNEEMFEIVKAMLYVFSLCVISVIVVCIMVL